jgi:hypothetical protein
MVPERDGNRMIAEVVTKKTEELNWQPKHDIKEYIKSLKKIIEPRNSINNSSKTIQKLR